ncbi:MAG: DUF2232 domain-containing protein [Eubacteriales bacterium]|jgi:hypothetical protein
MERTKQKAKIILTSFLCIAMCVLGAKVPLGNPLTTMVGAGALAVLVFRAPLWVPALTVVLGAAFSFALGCSLGLVISAMLCMLAAGVAMGVCMKREYSFKQLMLVLIAVVTLINGGLSLLSVYLNFGSITVDNMLAPYEDIYYTMEQAFVAAGNTAYEASMAVKGIRDFMGSVLIGYIVLSSMLIAFGACLCTLGLMWLLYRVVFPQYRFLRSFQVSRVGGIFFLISFLGMIVFTDRIMVGAFSNFVLIFAPVFLLEGLSLLEWNFNRMGMKWLTKAALYICIFATLFLPFVNMVNACVALGVLDSLADYRKTRRK